MWWLSSVLDRNTAILTPAISGYDYQKPSSADGSHLGRRFPLPSNTGTASCSDLRGPSS